MHDIDPWIFRVWCATLMQSSRGFPSILYRGGTKDTDGFRPVFIGIRNIGN